MPGFAGVRGSWHWALGRQKPGAGNKEPGATNQLTGHRDTGVSPVRRGGAAALRSARLARPRRPWHGKTANHGGPEENCV